MEHKSRQVGSEQKELAALKEEESPKTKKPLGSLRRLQSLRPAKGIPDKPIPDPSAESPRRPEAGLYDVVPVGYVTIDEQSRILEANLTFSNMVSVDRAELTGESFTRFLGKEEATTLARHLRVCRKASQPVVMELELRNRDGTLIPVQIMSVSGCSEEEVPSHFFLAITDLTEIQSYREATEDLEAEKALLEAVINGVEDSVFVKDLEGRYVLSNPANNKLLEVEPRQIIGKKVSEVLSADDLPPILESDRQVLESGEPVTYEHTIHRGVLPRIYLTNKALWRDAKGRPRGLLGISRDITKQKKIMVGIEQDLAQALEERTELQQELAETESEKEEIVTDLSQVRERRDDLMATLNSLDIGTATADEEGKITLLSRSSERLLERNHKDVNGQSWQVLFPVEEGKLDELKTLSALPPDRRTRVPIELTLPSGRAVVVEVSVQDDPRDSRKRIFCFHDVTEIHTLRGLLSKKSRFGDLVGKSRGMLLVFQRIQEFSQVDTTVLIQGETGTGKELVARGIHFSSQRKRGPFVPVNCAGLAESIVESQLFGHKKGSFTGAFQDQKGVFEAAHGGTIFLDEIGDLPQNVQSRLLRVLQEREVVRLGETKPRKVDARFLAATNKALQEEVEKGRFRPDLYYRINVARIEIPPLRERKEDIPLLAGVFLRQIQAATSKRIERLSAQAMRVLMDYAWPGNVRELQNVLENAAIRCGGFVIEIDDLSSEIVVNTSAQPRRVPDETNKEEDEKKRLLDALERADGNRALAARVLGIGRSTFYRRLAKYGIVSTK